MKKNIKLVCIDLDGTLLNSNKEISEKNRKAIKEATEKGVKVVVSTGRFYNMASHFSNMLDLKTPIISSNGAYIRRFHENQVISKTLLGYTNCVKVFDIIKKHQLDPFFNDDDTIYIDEENEYLKFNEKINGRLAKLGKSRLQIVDNWEKMLMANQNSILKCLVVNSNVENLNKAKEELLRKR